MLQTLERRFDQVNRVVERLPFDDQRRSQAHNRLARLLGQYATLEESLAELASSAPRRIDVDADKQAAAAHVPDRRVIDALESPHHVCAKLGGTFDQLLIAQHRKSLRCNSCRQRIAA